MIRDAVYEDIEKLVPLAIEMHRTGSTQRFTAFYIPIIAKGVSSIITGTSVFLIAVPGLLLFLWGLSLNIFMAGTEWVYKKTCGLTEKLLCAVSDFPKTLKNGVRKKV